MRDNDQTFKFNSKADTLTFLEKKVTKEIALTHIVTNWK